MPSKLWWKIIFKLKFYIQPKIKWQGRLKTFQTGKISNNARDSHPPSPIPNTHTHTRNVMLWPILFLKYSWFTILCSFHVYSKVIPLYIYMHIYILFYSFPLEFITRYWIYFPVLYSKSLLFIYFIYGNVHLLIPYSQFIPTPPFPLVTISLFSMSVSLFLFCK